MGKENKTSIHYGEVETKTKKIKKTVGVALQAKVNQKYDLLKRRWRTSQGRYADQFAIVLEKERTDIIEALNCLEQLQNMLCEAAQAYDEQDKAYAKESVNEKGRG